ncbi:MAG: hypothetical protein AABZ14_03565 [Candidatus Margulisiibacteriota bacterium]
MGSLSVATIGGIKTLTTGQKNELTKIAEKDGSAKSIDTKQEWLDAAKYLKVYTGKDASNAEQLLVIELDISSVNVQNDDRDAAPIEAVAAMSPSTNKENLSSVFTYDNGLGILGAVQNGTAIKGKIKWHQTFGVDNQNIKPEGRDIVLSGAKVTGQVKLEVVDKKTGKQFEFWINTADPQADGTYHFSTKGIDAIKKVQFCGNGSIDFKKGWSLDLE